MSSALSVKLSARALAVIALALAGTQAAAAQPRLCTVIQPGETASLVAQRMTGEARRRHEPWFQIVDPVTSHVVPKATYDYVRTGWNACVVTGLTRARAPQSAESDLGLWTLLFGSIALMTYGADHYFRSRRKVVDGMQQFGRRFVQEFERPLIRPDIPAPPIQSRVRAMPLAERLEILIAPGAGRCYPNLADHRKNVEYDLKRVLKVLRDQPFVNGPPYMRGRWVVLPFQWKPRIAQAGGK